jgi:hypothetical protein
VVFLATAKNLPLPNSMLDHVVELGNTAAVQLAPLSTEYAATVPPVAIATKYEEDPIIPPAMSDQVVLAGNVAAVHDCPPLVENAAALDPDLTATKLLSK